MRKRVDSKAYGLTARTVLMETGPEQFTLVINRKTRIIMKDAQKILSNARILTEHAPNATIVLETTAPVCSKSIAFLQKNGISIVKSAI